MSGSICVTKMIHHMVDEVNRAMKGTKQEGEGQFYHDALMIMTCEKSKAYILEHDLLKYWLLPLDDLQKGTRYHNSIPGDSPEMMPLDETLNMDIHACAATASLSPPNSQRANQRNVPSLHQGKYRRHISASLIL
jgi:hypothetical protein